MGDEGLLKRVEPSGYGICEAFDGRNCCPIALDCQYLAGEHCPSIHDDGTGAARGMIAGDFRPSQPEGLPQRVGQRVEYLHLSGSAADVQLIGLPIYNQSDRFGLGGFASLRNRFVFRQM